MASPERSVMRLLAMSRTGRFVAMIRTGCVELVDALGTSPRVRIDGEVIDLACVGTAVWLVPRSQPDRIDRYATSGKQLDSIALPAPVTSIVADRSDGLQGAIITGLTPVMVIADRGVELCRVPRGRAVAPLAGRSYGAVVDDTVVLCELGRTDPVATLAQVGDDHVLGMWPLYGGRLVAIAIRAAGNDIWRVVRRDGNRVRDIVAPRARRWTVATEAGVALLACDDQLVRVDLRYGAVRAEGRFSLHDLEISADGHYVAVAHGDLEAPAIVHLPTTELFTAANRPAIAEQPDVIAIDDLPREPVVLAEVTPGERVANENNDEPLPLPVAFGAALPALTITADERWQPYASTREHLDDLLDLVAARAARAIAQAWHTGRLSASIDAQPYFREVEALLGEVAGLAPSELAAADARVAAMADRVAGRIRATIAAGVRLPFVELMRELDLSPEAGNVLMVVLAPSERGEIARLFGILASDPHRPLVDRHLVETVLAGPDRLRREAIASELAPGAPLVRQGVLQVAAGHAMFQALAVDPVVIARLCERCHREAPRHVRAWHELAMPGDVVRELASLLARPRRSADPLRLVIRGPLGSGRRSIIAALAALVDRGVRDVDCARLSRGVALAGELAGELRAAVLRGAVPIVSGLETSGGDAEMRDRLAQVLRGHAGPIVIRTAVESSVPIDRGAATVTIPPLSETARAAFWRAALARASVTATDIDGLAARWRIGPGIVQRVLSDAIDRGAQHVADATAILDEAARSHIAARLDHVATPIRRLASWENVALPDDVLDSIRELVGRIAQRRTVLEDWGFDAKVASARGLTALFYGAPGTGKSMVAGLIARELGLELYRVDLSRVMSKWIGETEKNLGEVFDAAEAGQVVILFDEADSLFAKRTEVKTSVDRYANLEVNYLLQRLDTFEGIAILTTNLDGSIDPAFKRRMSLRLQFPFPDAEMRQRLWATHIPAQAPIAGDFDFAALAHKFPLSGGYIRNSALRAAYLAAQERRPLAQEHLLRAIALEYRELGKLASDGRIE